MSKTRNLSKVLALVIMLALVIGILPMGAMAAIDRTSRTFYNDSNVAVSTVTVSGSGIAVAGISDWTISSSTEASFVVSLSPNCSLASVTVTINPVSGTSGSATFEINETKSITAGGIAYTVTVQKESSYVAATVTGTNAYIGGVTGEGVTVSSDGTTTSGGHTIYKFKAEAAATSYPYPVSLRIIPGGTDYDNTSYTLSVSSSTATLKNFVGTYYLANFTGNNDTLDFSITTGSNTIYYRVTFVSTGGSAATGNNAFAYLPAPGQFTNEGMGTGGWGDVYTSAGALKNFSGSSVLTTGVSLGAFGGYLVYDFGDNGLSNSDTTPYGIDFIVYGNAFWDNSELGCLQVYGTKNGTDYAWYDIAGSLYYTSATTKNYDATYGNPNPSDTPSGTLASVPYTLDNWTSNGLVTKNTFHNHSWFPLDGNYFSSRTISSQTAPAMAKTATLPFATYQTEQSYSYVENGTTYPITGGQTVKLTGVCLDTSTTKAKTQEYLFGYADIHPKGSGSLNAPYNPYALSGITSASAYNSLIANCGGGDPIDISWAVNGAGEPVHLTKIKYVRIYTGTQQMNGAFGEVSAEVCGVYAASGIGDGAGSAPTIKIGKNSATTTLSTSNMGCVDYAFSSGTSFKFKVTLPADASGDAVVYVNGEKVTSGTTLTYSMSAGNSTLLQVITQDGTNAPYITLIRVSR